VARSLSVSRVGAADRTDWERLWGEWQAHMSGRVPAEITARSWAMLSDPDSGLDALIARDETGRAIGFANISRTNFAWTGGQILFLQDLFVSEDACGAGAGATLVKGVYELADEIGASQVFWMVDEDDKRLQGFYARHGIRTPYLRYMRKPWPW
jgi:GNAT superfamily N-acetyltransferase